MVDGDSSGRRATGPSVEIEYCTQCRWMLRAAWMAQELLQTFEGQLGAVTLIPGSGGVFDIVVRGTDGEAWRVWSRAEAGRFPDIKELKQRVRDIIAPERALGHTDRPASPA